MLTNRNSAVLAIAPKRRYHIFGIAQTTLKPMPHHIRIYPR